MRREFAKRQETDRAARDQSYRQISPAQHGKRRESLFAKTSLGITTRLHSPIHNRLT
jgi:hypothetical protein